MTAGITRRDKIQEFCVAIGLSLFAMLLFYFSTKATLHDFDYTGRIASALLRGHLGLETRSEGDGPLGGQILLSLSRWCSS